MSYSQQAVVAVLTGLHTGRMEALVQGGEAFETLMETPQGLPLIVLAHGGPAARDVAGFDYWAQAMASRGYAVLQANFRGSTGYGRAFLEAQ